MKEKKLIERIVFTNPVLSNDIEVEPVMVQVYDEEDYHDTHLLYGKNEEDYTKEVAKAVRDFLESHHLDFDEAVEKGLISSDGSFAKRELEQFAEVWPEIEEQFDINEEQEELNVEQEELELEAEQAEDMKITNVVFIENVMDDGTTYPCVELIYEDEFSEVMDLLDENGHISEEAKDIVSKFLEEKHMSVKEAILEGVISASGIELERFLDEHMDEFSNEFQHLAVLEETGSKKIRQIVMYHFDGKGQMEPTENNLDNPDRGMIAQACIFYEDGTFKNIFVSDGTYTYVDELSDAVYEFTGKDMSLLDAIHSGAVTSVSGEEFEEDFKKYLKGVYHAPKESTSLVPLYEEKIDNDMESQSFMGRISKVLSRVSRTIHRIVLGAKVIKEKLNGDNYKLEKKSKTGFLKNAVRKFYKKHPNITGGIFAFTLSAIPFTFWKMNSDTNYTCSRMSKVGVVKEFTDRNEESIQDILAKQSKKKDSKDKKDTKKKEKQKKKKVAEQQKSKHESETIVESTPVSTGDSSYKDSYQPEEPTSFINEENNTKEKEKAKKTQKAEKEAEKKRKKAEKLAKAKLKKDQQMEDAKKNTLDNEIASSNQDFQENIDNANNGQGPINPDVLGNGVTFGDENKDQNGNLVDSVEDVTTDGTDSSSGELPDPGALDSDDNYVEQGSYNIVEGEVDISQVEGADVVIVGNSQDSTNYDSTNKDTSSTMTESEVDIEKVAEEMVNAMANEGQQETDSFVKTK